MRKLICFLEGKDDRVEYGAISPQESDQLVLKMSRSAEEKDCLKGSPRLISKISRQSLNVFWVLHFESDILYLRFISYIAQE